MLPTFSSAANSASIFSLCSCSKASIKIGTKASIASCSPGYLTSGILIIPLLFVGIILSGGSVIGVAVNKIFDAKNIKIMVELQGEIKSLQREAKYKENDLSRLEIVEKCITF